MKNSELYSPSLTLLTDLYQLTMAYGYWKLGLAERQAVFHLTYRRNPFGGDHAIAAGLEPALGYLTNSRFGPTEAEYLATLTGNDCSPLFEPAFLDFLVNTPYRRPVDFGPTSLEGARKGLLRLYRQLGERLEEPTIATLDEVLARDLPADLAAHRARFCEAMDDDFNTSIAVAPASR